MPGISFQSAVKGMGPYHTHKRCCPTTRLPIVGGGGGGVCVCVLIANVFVICILCLTFSSWLFVGHV